MSVRAQFEVSGAPFAVVIRPPDEDERAAIIDPPRWILSLWEQVRKRKRRDPKIYEYLWQGFSSIAPRLAMRVRVDRAPVPEGVFASSVAEGFSPSWESLEEAKRDVAEVLGRAGAEWDGRWETT